MNVKGPELTKDLLSAPAPHAVRVIALARLTDVGARYERLWSGDDESLHDLRVAVRRLRSWLRAYRPALDDTLRRKARRRLTKVARATNGARDAEVAMAWITLQSDLTARERPGARYLLERLQRELDATRGTTRDVLESDLPKLLTMLSDQLSEYWQHHSVEKSSSPKDMLSVTRDVLEQSGARLARAMDRIESPTDFAGVHRARIAAKRLRYLLEALNGDPDATALVGQLTTLQDVLGVVHDSHRIVNRLVREVGEVAARDARHAALRAIDLAADDADESESAPSFARIRPGLIALTKRAHERERSAFRDFRRRWRKRRVESTIGALDTIVAALG